MTDNDMDDASPDQAIEEAVHKLQQTYPEVEFAPEKTDVSDIARLITNEAASTDIRQDAARILSMLAEQFPEVVRPTVPQLVASLNESNSPVRKNLLLTIGYVSKASPKTVADSTDRFVILLDSGVPESRHASWILANVAEYNPDAVDKVSNRFVELLDSDDQEVRRHAVRAVGALAETTPEIAEKALPPLFDLLESTTLYRTVGRALVRISATHGEEVSNELLAKINEARPSVREHAAWTMVEVAKERPDLFWHERQYLIEIVRDDDDHQVRNCAVATLTTMAIKHSESNLIGELISLLDHNDLFVRRYGCLALGDIAVATGQVSAIRALAKAQENEVGPVGNEAKRQLANIASEFPEKVADVDPGLLETLSQDET